MRVGRCNSPKCGARIFWVSTINGGVAPLDVDPVPEGNIVLVKRTEAERPMALVLTDKRFDAFGDGTRDKMVAADVAFYVDHHATCADVESFRDVPF